MKKRLKTKKPCEGSKRSSAITLPVSITKPCSLESSTCVHLFCKDEVPNKHLNAFHL